MGVIAVAVREDFHGTAVSVRLKSNVEVNSRLPLWEVVIAMPSCDLRCEVGKGIEKPRKLNKPSHSQSNCPGDSIWGTTKTTHGEMSLIISCQPAG